jgi:hypothetical protein
VLTAVHWRRLCQPNNTAQGLLVCSTYLSHCFACGWGGMLCLLSWLDDSSNFYRDRLGSLTALHTSCFTDACAEGFNLWTRLRRLQVKRLCLSQATFAARSRVGVYPDCSWLEAIAALQAVRCRVRLVQKGLAVVLIVCQGACSVLLTCAPLDQSLHFVDHLLVAFSVGARQCSCETAASSSSFTFWMLHKGNRVDC